MEVGNFKVISQNMFNYTEILPKVVMILVTLICTSFVHLKSQQIVTKQEILNSKKINTSLWNFPEFSWSLLWCQLQTITVNTCVWKLKILYGHHKLYSYDTFTYSCIKVSCIHEFTQVEAIEINFHGLTAITPIGLSKQKL